MLKYSSFALWKDNYAKAIIIFVVSKEIIIYILVSVSLNRLTTIFLQWIIKPVIQQQVFLLWMTSFIAINNHGIYPQLRWKRTFLWWHWLWHKRFAPIPWACFQCLWKIACLQSAIASQLCKNILELYFMWYKDRTLQLSFQDTTKVVIFSYWKIILNYWRFSFFFLEIDCQDDGCSLSRSVACKEVFTVISFHLFFSCKH